MSWSKASWQRIEGIYSEILKMPFITQLTDGTLPVSYTHLTLPTNREV